MSYISLIINTPVPPVLNLQAEVSYYRSALTPFKNPMCLDVQRHVCLYLNPHFKLRCNGLKNDFFPLLIRLSASYEGLDGVD